MTLNAIIANFQTFKLVDLLDIIIISFLIYQLLGIVNRTRAGQLFKGALLVMAVYLVAETLNMRTVTWLLNSLLQVGLLTLVVLFQPEIRRALERMGQTDQWAAKLFNVKGRYNDPSHILCCHFVSLLAARFAGSGRRSGAGCSAGSSTAAAGEHAGAQSQSRNSCGQLFGFDLSHCSCPFLLDKLRFEPNKGYRKER